jgi:hypothetical protein
MASKAININKEFISKLDKIRTDYVMVAGKPFNYFFCPILFKDEEVTLCKAHIINRAFRKTDKTWTIQQKDVDNFYGSNFEADYTFLPYAKSKTSTDICENAFVNKAINKKLAPKIFLNGKQVEYFIARKQIPKHFAHIDMRQNDQTVSLGLKMSPELVLASLTRHWEIGFFKDMVIPSVVSLIKAAHLTLFNILGYRYVFSKTGEYVGNHILGEFYRQNCMKQKIDVLKNAKQFFNKFKNMVRPILSNGLNFQGTISDNIFLVCWNNADIWAKIVLVRTESLLHAVLVPILDQSYKLKAFKDFLENQTESITVSLCQFDNDHWNINEERNSIKWPKGI